MTSIVAFLDLEASSLGRDGHPIEVGVAKVMPDASIERYSWIIRPHPDWTFSDGGEWDPVAVELTGLSPCDVRERGRDPKDVVIELDAVLADVTAVYSDAPEQDSAWLAMLYDAADAGHTVAMSDVMEIDRLQAKMNLTAARNLWERKLEHVDARHYLTRHRAGPDAERLARAYVLLGGARR